VVQHRRCSLNMSTNTETAIRPLRDSEWGMKVFNYTPERRSAFWQFVYTNGIPVVRLSPRKLMFDEQQIRDYIARRSTGGQR
jgi:hypothetical protein